MRYRTCTPTLNYAAVHGVLWERSLPTPRATSSRKTSPHPNNGKQKAAEPASTTWHQWGKKKITIGNFNVQGLSSNPPTVLPAHQLFHWTLLYNGLFQLLCLWVIFHCRPKQQCKFGLSVRILVTHWLSTSNNINGNWRDSDTGRKSRKISNYICFEHASGCWLHRGSKNPTKLWPVNLGYCSKCTLANALSHSSSPEPEPPPLAKHLMTQTAAPDRIPTAAHRF